MRKKLATFTLNDRQVKAACEAYVGPRINAETETAVAAVPAGLSVTVSVSKRYTRPAKTETSHE